MHIRKLLCALLCISLCLSPCVFGGEVIEPTVEATEAPAASEEPTNEPPKTEEPAQTQAPAETEDPDKTEEPAQTQAPAETEDPDKTEDPVNTEEPDKTEDPDETEDPVNTEEPDETEDPVNTEEPDETEDPANTEEPKVTEDPEVTEEPGETEEAGETDEPGETVATDESGATEAPEAASSAPSRAASVESVVAINGCAELRCALVPADDNAIYEWQRLIPGGEWQMIQSGSAATLALNNLNKSDNSQDAYRCVAHCSDGDYISNEAALTEFIYGADPADIGMSFRVDAGEATLIDAVAAETVDVPESIIIDSRAYPVTGVELWSGKEIDSEGIERDKPFIGALRLPKTVKRVSLSEHGGVNIREIEVAADNPYFTVFDGMLFSADMRALLLCPKGFVGGVALSDALDEICEYAFMDCDGLTSVDVLNPNISIAERAFPAHITLRGHYGSAAVKYAQSNGIKFEYINKGEVFDAARAVTSDTWRYIDMTRASGYNGKLARVTGTLALEGVTLNGVPAEKIDFRAAFEALPGGGVRIINNSGVCLNRSLICLYKGKKFTLSLANAGAGVSAKSVKWKSAKTSIAKVSSKGVVTASKAGTTVISASYGGKTVTCAIVVVTPVSRVKLKASAKEISIGGSVKISATVSPSKAEYKQLTWTSSNTAVAQVDSSGRVTGVGAGNAVIKARSLNGKNASIKIKVIRPVESVKITESVSIYKGKKLKLTPQYTPANATYRTVKWSTSNRKVATVNSKGEIKAVAKGSCVITAKAHNGVKATCVVTVLQPVTSVKLTKSLNVSLYSTKKLSVKISPSSASDKTIRWSSSAPSIASVDQNGVVTGHANGKATITAASVNGKKATCKVTVKEIKPSSIAFKTPFVTLDLNQTYATGVAIKPGDASNKAVSYASSDTGVASVDNLGVITAVGYGDATITVRCAANNSVKASCRVFVLEPGAGRMTGLVIGINPGHQTKTITKKYPIAPGSKTTAYGCKVGARGKFTRVYEYETNLKISLKLAELLIANGATVVMTRTRNDVSLTNIERAQMLNNANVDVALQMHCNSSSNAKAIGLSCYVRTTGAHAQEDKAIASSLCSAMSAATGAKNLGVKINNNYMSLNWTTTPSVLLEMGYLSNEKEDKLLSLSDDYQQDMAQGIYEGLANYFGR